MSIDDLKEVYTFTEAAKVYKLDTSTLRKAVAQNRFTEEEVDKKGKTWFVTKEAMERLYGHRRLSISERANQAQKRSSELVKFSHASKSNLIDRER
jgi:hypothetical protein